MKEIQLLDFDSKLFGFKVAKFTETKLDPKIAERIIGHCEKNSIKCCYADLDINDFISIDTAIKYGFVMADVRITFEKDISDFNYRNDPLQEYGFDDTVNKHDLSFLTNLSKELSFTSRFAFDENFPKGSAELLYETWIANSVSKKAADKVFIARDVKTQTPAGFITCNNGLDHGRIILFVVRKDHRRRQLGTNLLGRACRFFKENGVCKVRVVTEARNIAAQRLYQKKGFLTYSVSAFFHLWIK